MAIDVKTAVEIAVKYMKDLPAQEAQFATLLEEVELSDDERFWFITLSYFNRDPQFTSVVASLQRKFKKFKIDAANGRVMAMTMVRD